MRCLRHRFPKKTLRYSVAYKNASKNSSGTVIGWAAAFKVNT